MHLVPAAKLARDGVQPQPNGLPKEIPELVLPIYREVAAPHLWGATEVLRLRGRAGLVLPIHGEVAAPHLWGAGAKRLRGWAGGARRSWQGGGLVHLHNRDCSVFSRGRAVRHYVLSVPIRDRGGLLGTAARAAAAALGAARLAGIVDNSSQSPALLSPAV